MINHASIERAENGFLLSYFNPNGEPERKGEPLGATVTFLSPDLGGILARLLVEMGDGKGKEVKIK